MLNKQKKLNPKTYSAGLLSSHKLGHLITHIHHQSLNNLGDGRFSTIGNLSTIG